MSTHDTHDRLDLTGPWAGFGFQGGHMFTPEGHHLEPTDMVWWSLTCNIAREWRTMMDEVRPAHQRTHLTADRSMRPGGPNVIYLRDALLKRRQRTPDARAYRIPRNRNCMAFPVTDWNLGGGRNGVVGHRLGDT